MSAKSLMPAAAAILLAFSSGAIAQSLTPPDFTAAGGLGGGPWVYGPPYSQTLSGTKSINAVRIRGQSGTATEGSRQTDLQLILVSPDNSTLELGPGGSNWFAPFISGTGSWQSHYPLTFDGIYAFDAGDIEGVWTVNFRNTWEAGTLSWSNIEITPLQLFPGACCLPSGACSEEIELICLKLGGAYHGDNTTCISTPPGGCPQPPIGACCLASGSCIIEWEGGCITLGGTYRGDGTDCTSPHVPCLKRIDAYWNSPSNTIGDGAGAFILVEATDPAGIVIEGFDINVHGSAGRPTAAHVYFRPDTFVGYTSDPSAWMLLGEVPIITAGAGNPTHVPIGGLHIAGGETWALRIGVDVALRFTQPPLPTVNDDHVTLHMGEMQHTFFGPGTSGNYLTGVLRGWDGSMYYRTGAVVSTGACCLPNGLCDEVREAVCLGRGGAYHGDHTTCASSPPGGCPQPQSGACCIPAQPGGCIFVSEFDCKAEKGLYLGDNLPCGTLCDAYFFEVEPNNTKHRANRFTLASGQAIVGTSTLSSGTGDPASPDYFLIRTEPAPPGIYRHRMTLTSPFTSGPVHSPSLQGRSQSAVPSGPWPCSVGTFGISSDMGAQNHLVVDDQRINYWYGFGREERVYYRIFGTPSTPGFYIARLTTDPVTPASIGTFQAGQITITTADQYHTSDTALRVYDADFRPVYGYANDRGSIHGGHSTNSSNVSFLRRDYAPGTYYLAITVGALAASQGAPCDDHFRTRVMADYPDVVFNASTLGATDVSFRVIDSLGSVGVSAHREGPRQIAWFTFDVEGLAEIGACCFDSGGCEVIPPTLCAAQDGGYLGSGTDCAPNPCPQPPKGACCLPEGGCIIDWVGGCAEGIYMGDGTDCSVNCPFILVTDIPNNRLAAPESGIMLDVTPDVDIAILRIDSVSDSAAGTPITVEIWTTPGPYEPVRFNPAAWVLHDTVTAIAGEWDTPAQIALNIPLELSGNQTTGIYLIKQSGGIRYTGPNDVQTMWMDDHITLYSAHALGSRWTSIYTPRVLSGTIYYTVSDSCYADCDGSGTINIDDFMCFINEFASAQSLPVSQQVTHYANCDGSTAPPVLNVDDFLCFINEFAHGCP